MSNTKKGTISKIFDREVKGRTYYSFKVGGDDTYYGSGAKRPPPEGTYIQFEAEKNQRGFWDAKNIQVVEADTTPQTQVSKAAVSASKSLSKDDYWTRREERDVETQKRIELQSCRNSAIELVRLLVSVPDALPELKKKNKTDTADYIVGVVDYYTQYYKDQNDNKDQSDKAPVEDTEQEGSVSSGRARSVATDDATWVV